MRSSFDGDCTWENQGADYPVPSAMLGGGSFGQPIWALSR